MRSTHNSRSSFRGSRLLAAATLTVLTALAGCANLSDAQLEQAARARAEQRWQALIRQDFEGAYALHSPGWRGLNPFPEWRERFGRGQVLWLAAESVGSTCDPSPPVRCVVRVKLRAQVLGLRVNDVPRDDEILETWIRQDGQWWMVPS